MSDSHYHFVTGCDDDDPYVSENPGPVFHDAARYFDIWADTEHSNVSIYGNSGMYEDAYRAFQRSETYSNLQANCANIAKQWESNRVDRAPLYQGDDWEALLTMATDHVMDMVNDDGPNGCQLYRE